MSFCGIRPNIDLWLAGNSLIDGSMSTGFLTDHPDPGLR